jgi:hypothetical protein
MENYFLSILEGVSELVPKVTHEEKIEIFVRKITPK